MVGGEVPDIFIFTETFVCTTTGHADQKMRLNMVISPQYINILY